VNKPRVLVVDDEPGLLRAVERVLSASYHTMSCRSAREALERAPGFVPDIALVDIRMPDRSGFELMDDLTAVCPAVDVIFMTGSLGQLDQSLVRAIRMRAFYFIQKPFDRDVLLTLLGRCMEVRRLAEENRSHVHRLQSELDAARAFQQGLLKPTPAYLNGVAISARYLPSAELGGDFYDFASAGAGSTAVLVADAAGHGAAAAMLTGVVKSAFDATRDERYGPLAVVRRVAAALGGFEAQRFVTLCCVRIDRDREELEYACAGHPPAWVWGPARPPERLDATGVLISSALRGDRWTARRVRFEEGDCLLLYTDGIIEREGPEGAFGEERLRAALDRRPRGGEALLSEVLDLVNAFAGHAPAADDMTLLLAEARARTSTP
jgi:sigma-B regulation protein RsbU (phosphoserine phosphatase)